MLSRRGWPLDDVYAALADYWAQRTGVEAPQRAASSEAARDAFFTTLLRDHGDLGNSHGRGALRPRKLPHPGPDFRVLRSQSSLRHRLEPRCARVFPDLPSAMRVLFLEARKTPERLQSGIRKWLTYGAAGHCGRGDRRPHSLLGYFLLGELTSRFLVKRCSCDLWRDLCLLSTSLRWDRDTAAEKQRACNRNFAALALAAVLSTFIAGIAVGGTPATQRMREADRQQVRDLQTIARAIRPLQPARGGNRHCHPRWPP